MRHTFATAFSIWATCFAFVTPAVADGPVVVELYTSQGCSSCPPADEMLHTLAARSDVIALALHVDYWDYIGWADSFADPAHTVRQQSYAHVAGASTIYTPQMIIGGADHVIGTKPMEVANLIQAHVASPTGASIAMQRSGNRLQITGETSHPLRSGTLVQVIRYSPQETVDIRSGENAGKSLSYVNIVTDWRSVGEWNGNGDLNMTVDVSGGGPIVVIVQEPGPGAIMATAVLR
ncbi:hypothetical protein OAN307_c21740 [Octadecabacter antarcticus 307]|uniref:Uncharacterized protein n=1 Tax=Octadecabacter antarcticus 307 TaxID=391626 RepID=M9RBL4_9RHOB|nr:DUF1223 domain-containing protein [Octadecabacter antarcticus]AGI67806.1 hypothetical protein OAN307_c21740 [Octadecabacter antarcticus 307]